MKRRNHILGRRGVILIFVAGVLTVLAALGASFFALSHASVASAVKYSDMVRAEFLAQAGLADAIARLRAQAFEKPEDADDPWFRFDYLNGATERVSFAAGGTANYSGVLGSSVTEDGDRYTLQVSDAASRININAGGNLGVILDNLCRLIGPPLVSARMDALQPRRWAQEGAPAGDYETTLNILDRSDERDLYYRTGTDGRPLVDDQGSAIYGDGYAVAAHRARHGRYSCIADIRQALTYIERNGNAEPDDPLERFEVEAKFTALREYLTVDSWIDTTTAGVGKFEWSGRGFAIDRDKSWIPNDLIDSYVAIVNGHGAGQLRRIKANGVDWIKVGTDFIVPPGPISSYIIYAREDAKLRELKSVEPAVRLPERDAEGHLIDDPFVDYARRPLCIHRAPVNINTASDKVLAALFMGLNVQHGHAMAVGTDADLAALRGTWFTDDHRLQEPFLLTAAGLKRLPANSGKIVFDRPRPSEAASTQFDYMDGGRAGWNEAQELALRIVVARQRKDAAGKLLGPDPFTGRPRGPFRSWDDLFHRVVKPWDDARSPCPSKATVARLIMANANPNTDILKFNPNIEWIDRWGRNFTEMEPVMLHANPYTPDTPLFVSAFEGTPPANPDPDDPTTTQPVSLWPYHLCKYGHYDPSDGTINKPSASDWGVYLVRGMRYRSTDLIDKTDLNRSTTEFAFDSAGVYRVVSTGQVLGPWGPIAERKIEAVVKVYDVWRESTQEQFVQGSISVAVGSPGTSTSGQVTRAMVWNEAAGKPEPNVSSRLALTTLPEPLVPVQYRLNVNRYYKEVVDRSRTGTDAFGRAKERVGDDVIPDVISNEVLPARYDGQIVLATNTTAYSTDDETTFLASFNGDLDTDTCRGNGREQAKTPEDRSVRCVDTCGLLGRLNDTEIDFDPSPIGARGRPTDPQLYAIDPHGLVPGTEMRPLNADCYWEHVTCRRGDLRPEGVWLGYVGGSLKDATLKYKFHHNGEGGRNYLNYNPDEGTAGMGSTISMWFKPTWHCTDGREHEFFNADNKGSGFDARYNVLTKAGRYLGACKDNYWSGGTLFSENDLCWAMEDADDSTLKTNIHGGRANPVPENAVPESPAYRTQPFRWSFVGCVSHYWFQIDSWRDSFGVRDRKAFGFSVDTEGFTGTDDWRNPVAQEILGLHSRPFICTARGLEGEGLIPNASGARPSTQHMWGFADLRTVEADVEIADPENPGKTIPATGYVVDPQIRYPDIGMGKDAKQQLAWYWQDGKKTSACFSINATNEKWNGWVYRAVPTDGTQAVIDEFKICSGAMWDSSRIRQEMEVSRYYLPDDPTDRAQCPTFTSQTLLQSLRGHEAQAAGSNEWVSVARVSWSVFTPRFQYENKSQLCSRKEYLRTGNSIGDEVRPQSIAFRGPFDYVQYNHELGIPESAINVREPALSVDRPSRAKYRALGLARSHAGKGVEIEVLDGTRPLEGTSLCQQTGTVADAVLNPKTGTHSIFTDPGRANRIATARCPSRVRIDRLRYRVRFRYYVDQLVKRAYNPEAELREDEQIDPAKHYLLDTPVFDDISVVYLAPVRILNYRDVTE